MKDALLIVDMLNDFLTGELKCERGWKIVPSIKRLTETARETGVPVIFCGDAHLESDFELSIWGEHAMRGSKGAEVIPELSPQQGDYILEKRTYSCFFETPLDTLLRSLGTERLVITGLHTNICDRHTAADAFFRGYKVVIPEDAVEAMDEESHRTGLDYLREIYGAEITDSESLISSWRESSKK